MQRLLVRAIERHGACWALDRRYGLAWYVWPQAACLAAATWLMTRVPEAPPTGAAWASPSQAYTDHVSALMEAAKKDLRALQRLRRLAEAGDRTAQHDMGILHDPIYTGRGKTTSADRAVAMDWYLKAAQQGHPYAMGNYALHVFLARSGSPEDYGRLFPSLMEAANRFVVAQRLLGQALQVGQGTQKDPAAAIEWLRKAADKNDAIAQESLADAYVSGDGVPQSMAEAFIWYRRAADQKSPSARRQLGLMLLNGTGVARDPAGAFEHFKQSAQDGDAPAQYHLGVMYLDGIHVQKTPDTALVWLRKSAEQGFAEAQNRLGLIYWKGISVAPNKETARAWFEKAAANGLAEAADNLRALNAQRR